MQQAATVSATVRRTASPPRGSLAGGISRLRFARCLCLGEYAGDEGQQGRHRVEIPYLPRNDMLDTANHVRCVQRRVGVKLHDKGPLRGEPGGCLVLLCHPAGSLVFEDNPARSDGR
jgi:hypothetical protein